MTFTLPAYPVEYLDIKFFDENQEGLKNENSKQILPFSVSDIIFASVKSAKYLTSGADVKSVVEVNLNIKDTNIEYEPGQTIGILPQNDFEEVQNIIKRLNIENEARKKFQIFIKKDCTKKNAKIPLYLPNVTTIFDCLTTNLDIRSVPKKLFLRALSKYTSNDIEVNILNELCSSQGSEKYNNFITNNYMTLLYLLNTFKSCNPPFSILLEHLPKLQPRPYSISSSMLEYKEKTLKFAYYLEILPDNLIGVCTGWLTKELKNVLDNHSDNKKIPFYLRKTNDFKLPDNSINIIMIAAGTGLAPFLGFLYHRKLQMQNNKDLTFGKNYLYYGCRYSDRDFLFKNEINDFATTGIISKLFTAFSREGDNIKYVQDNIKKSEKDFINFFEDNAIIFVCGSMKMSKDVFETIVNCWCNVKQCTKDESLKTWNEFKKQKKYIEDIWT